VMIVCSSSYGITVMTIRIESLDILKVSKQKCVECGRVFNLLDKSDADEFHYGHDCEAK